LHQDEDRKPAANTMASNTQCHMMSTLELRYALLHSDPLSHYIPFQAPTLNGTSTSAKGK
jgi:hypothetical protein